MASKSSKSAVTPATSRAPSRRLIPRNAPPPEALPVAVADSIIDQSGDVSAQPKPVRARERSRSDDAFAKDQRSPATVDRKKGQKLKLPAKPRKAKLVRGAFKMPESEHEQFAKLKKRLKAMHFDVRKNELLRAGLRMLHAQSDAELLAVTSSIERIKGGRSGK